MYNVFQVFQKRNVVLIRARTMVYVQLLKSTTSVSALWDSWERIVKVSADSQKNRHSPLITWLALYDNYFLSTSISRRNRKWTIKMLSSKCTSGTNNDKTSSCCSFLLFHLQPHTLKLLALPNLSHRSSDFSICNRALKDLSEIRAKLVVSLIQMNTWVL